MLTLWLFSEDEVVTEALLASAALVVWLGICCCGCEQSRLELCGCCKGWDPRACADRGDPLLAFPNKKNSVWKAYEAILIMYIAQQGTAPNKFACEMPTLTESQFTKCWQWRRKLNWELAGTNEEQQNSRNHSTNYGNKIWQMYRERNQEIVIHITSTLLPSY